MQQWVILSDAELGLSQEGNNALMVALRHGDVRAVNSLWPHRKNLDINQANNVLICLSSSPSLSFCPRLSLAVDVCVVRLKRKYDQLSALWKSQHRRLRFNTIFATINLIKGWDLKQVSSD